MEETILSGRVLSATMEEIAKSTKLPLFRVRSITRELFEAGLIKDEEKYPVTKLD